MSDRRTQSLWGLVVCAVIVGGVAGWYFFFGSPDHVYRATPPLEVETYLAQGESLKGNRYRLEGEVLASLAWSPSGRLISVGLEEGKRAVPVLLPGRLQAFNIEKGQRLRFVLEVGDKGVLHATEVLR